MKRLSTVLICTLFLSGSGLIAAAADATKPSPDKNAGSSVAATARDVKEETVKLYKESKEAVVRDVKAMKEDIPRGLKEARESAVQQSKEIKQSVAQEFQEARDNLANPKLTPKSQNK
ncbi:MAG: hypothetical protein EG826_01495 [Deltaproteobacteria bacterium]|nr:hypothetical protein [Deltaproteobacteria bacterium]